MFSGSLFSSELVPGFARLPAACPTATTRCGRFRRNPREPPPPACLLDFEQLRALFTDDKEERRRTDPYHKARKSGERENVVILDGDPKEAQVKCLNWFEEDDQHDTQGIDVKQRQPVPLPPYKAKRQNVGTQLKQRV